MIFCSNLVKLDLDLDLDPDPHSEKLLDPDPDPLKMNAHPQPWFLVYIFTLLDPDPGGKMNVDPCGSTALNKTRAVDPHSFNADLDPAVSECASGSVSRCRSSLMFLFFWELKKT